MKDKAIVFEKKEEENGDVNGPRPDGNGRKGKESTH